MAALAIIAVLAAAFVIVILAIRRRQ